MAITANVDLGNGVSATSAYLIVPTAYVKKMTDDSFKLIYDVEIYQNKSARDGEDRFSKRITCNAVDHHKIAYDPTTSDNPFKLAYADLKTNGSLSSISDA
tara:strand:- start:214 stop:516 length:303 start_codon:yes stop_codon:yes gene_type:complete